MLWLVWSGARGELYGALYYAVIFAFIGLLGAVIAYLIYSMFIKIFSKKRDSDM
jgi:zinc transporter ZupT